MLILKKYKSILFFLVLGFPLYAPFFTSAYTYLFEPIHYQKDVNAEVLLREPTGQKGSAGEFMMFLFLKDYPFAKMDIYGLDAKSQRFYRQQVGKKIIVDVYYKINKNSSYQMTNSFVPVYIRTSDVVFLDKKQSKLILIDGLFLNAIFLIFFLLPICLVINFIFRAKGV